MVNSGSTVLGDPLVDPLFDGDKFVDRPKLSDLWKDNNTTALYGDYRDIQLQPWDLPSSILYIVFNLILSVTPVVFFYTFVEPIISAWTTNFNVMYIVSWYILWIGNLVLYAIPTVVGPFTWFWNAYVVGGYVGWSQYLVVWGGAIMQGINLILLLAGAIVYQDSGNGGADSIDTAFWEWGVFTIVTGGIYAGYYLMNPNFLAYYVIEEIEHKIKPFVPAGTTEETS